MIILYNKINRSTAERPKLHPSLVTLVQIFTRSKEQYWGENRLKKKTEGLVHVTASFFACADLRVAELGCSFLSTTGNKIGIKLLI